MVQQDGLCGIRVITSRASSSSSVLFTNHLGILPAAVVFPGVAVFPVVEVLPGEVFAGVLLIGLALRTSFRVTFLGALGEPAGRHAKGHFSSAAATAVAAGNAMDGRACVACGAPFIVAAMHWKGNSLYEESGKGRMKLPGQRAGQSRRKKHPTKHLIVP
jgi:hypothetical protein